MSSASSLISVDLRFSTIRVSLTDLASTPIPRCRAKEMQTCRVIDRIYIRRESGVSLVYAEREGGRERWSSLHNAARLGVVVKTRNCTAKYGRIRSLELRICARALSDKKMDEFTSTESCYTAQTGKYKCY